MDTKKIVKDILSDMSGKEATVRQETQEHIDNVIKGKFEIFEKREAQLRKEWQEGL